MKFRGIKIAALLCSTLLYNETILYANETDTPIPGVTWDVQNGVIEYDPSSFQDEVPAVLITGVSTDPNRGFLLNAPLYPNPKTGKFFLMTPITSQSNQVEVISVGSDGKDYRQVFQLVQVQNKGLAPMKLPVTLAFRDSYIGMSFRKDRRIGYGFGVGTSSFLYQQTQDQVLNQSTLGFLGLFQYAILPGKLGIQAQFNIDALPLSTNRNSITSLFINGKGQMEYLLPVYPLKILISPGIGYHYYTMSTLGSDFGYRNAHGPSLGLGLRRYFGSYLFHLYGSYALIVPRFAPSTWGNNHSIETGLNILFPLISQRPLTLNISTSHFAFINSSGTIAITNRSYSLNLILNY